MRNCRTETKPDVLWGERVRVRRESPLSSGACCPCGRSRLGDDEFDVYLMKIMKTANGRYEIRSKEKSPMRRCQPLAALQQLQQHAAEPTSTTTSCMLQLLVSQPGNGNARNAITNTDINQRNIPFAHHALKQIQHLCRTSKLRRSTNWSIVSK